jgi:hypothetical protein
MRFRLRTLLILLAVLPPLLWIGWGKYQAWKAEQERQRALAEAQSELAKFLGEVLLSGAQPAGPKPPPQSPPPLRRPTGE